MPHNHDRRGRLRSCAEVFGKHEAKTESGTALLAAEANHRIANNLSLIVGLLHAHAVDIRRQPGRIGRAEVASMLDDLGARVQTVAALHRLLSDGGPDAEIDIAGYLREVCETLSSAMSYRGEIDLSGLRFGCGVAAAQAMPIALIVGELITNSIKHARREDSRLAVAVCRGPDRTIVIEVADTGGGLPAGLDPLIDGGTGLWLVRTLGEQLRAELAFASNEIGLRVRLRVRVF